MDSEINRQIEEAKAYLDAACHTTDLRRYKKLLKWAKKILSPLAAQNIGPAMWLLASFQDTRDNQLTGEEFKLIHLEQIKEAARCGSASAMFYLGCELDQEPTLKESALYFEQAAELGHSYSKWCMGLNLLSGRGIDKDEKRGLFLIHQAAEEKFEGAIQFISHAYAQGIYGFPKDESLAAEWWSKLKDKELIHY